MTLNDLLAEIEAISVRLTRRAFVAYHLGKVKMDELPEDVQEVVKELSNNREFLEEVIDQDKQKPCKCGGDHCLTTRACEIALAKLDGSNVVQIASWTKH